MAARLLRAKLATLVPVRDMRRAIKFYTKTLGGKLRMRGEGKMKGFWASLTLGENEIWLIAPQKREKRTLAYSTFLVKNIKAVVKDLKGKGVKFQRAERMNAKSRIDGPIVFESFGASAFFKDSEGNLFMIWQNFMPM
jgi:predicted enzyme related to lactoylglutathione lyase